MTRIVFHSGKELDYYPDIIEYIRNIKKYSDFEVFYIGYSENGNEKKYSRELDIRVFNIGRNLSLADRLRTLRAYIKEIDPDVLHVFHYRGAGLVPAFLFREKVKSVLDVRTVAVEDKKGKPNSAFFLFLKDKLTWLESFTFNRVLALTPTIRKRLKPSRNEIPVIPLGANLELFKKCSDPEIKSEARTGLNVAKEEIVFLYSGVLTPSRNMDIPVEVISKIAAEDENITFLIVGGSYFEDYIERLKEIPLRYEVSDKVRFLGKVPYLDVPKFYAAADIGVSFTPVDTGYATQPPTKILEYLMSGMLVVSNRTPAVEDLIDDHTTGFLSGDSFKEFEEAIRLSIDYMKNRVKSGHLEKAIESVSGYSWNKIVQNKLLPFYESLQ